MRTILGNASGGLSYHGLACFRSEKAWRSYREDLGKWLAARAQRSTSLVLVGPSGGYTLETDFFGKFKNIAAFDPDPWSRWFFQKRHRKAAKAASWASDFSAESGNFLWFQEDFFGVLRGSGEWNSSAILDRLGFRPEETLFLFSNLLGQLEFLRRDYRNVLGAMGRAMAGMEWISVHDRFCTSLELKFAEAGAPESWETPERARDSRALAERFFVADSAPRGREAEVEEHDLDALWTAVGDQRGEWLYLPWRIRRRWTHLIEAVHFSRG